MIKILAILFIVSLIPFAIPLVVIFIIASLIPDKILFGEYYEAYLEDKKYEMD